MKNFMNSIKISKLPSTFLDLSHEVKTSFKMGYLIPSPPIDCVPGDVVRLNTQSLVRFAPLVAPVMHRFDVYHEYYFVAKRNLWKNWDKWITQTEVAGDLPAYPYVVISASDPNPDPAGDLLVLNHMGLPYSQNPDATEDEKISALPLVAYQQIYDQYYRNANIIDSDPDGLIAEDGDNSTNLLALAKLKRRAWEHDYFTSNLPEPQKGDPVMIPIGSQRVVLDDLATNPGTAFWRKADGTDFSGTDQNVTIDASVDSRSLADPSGLNAIYDPNGTLVTEDTGEATSINDLRLAYALQRLKEKLMRGGSRLTEFLRVVFGVTPQDARLDRPEYITGVKSPVIISEVLNTTGTDELPQGNMAGHGVSVNNGGYGKSYFVQEHGYIICITSVRPRTSYQQGIDRLWLKYTDPTEEFTPDMDHLGEQATLAREVYAYTVDGDKEFGYNPRYAEYRTIKNYTTGQYQTTLKHWTDTRIFTTQPALDETFISCDPDPRIFADLEGDHCYVSMYHEVKTTRRMSRYATPTY